MINEEEKDRVYTYMLKQYPIDIKFFDTVDEMIWQYVTQEKSVTENKDDLTGWLFNLRSRLVGELAKNKGITPTGVMLQERIYQLRIFLDKAEGKDDTDDLSKLCFACSFDTKWLEEESKKEVTSYV